MKNTVYSCLLSLLLAFVSCHPKSETATITNDGVEIPYVQDTTIAVSDQEPDVLHQIKLQVARGDYSQVEQLMNQVDAYEQDNTQNEELTGFPKLTQKLLIQLFSSLEPDALEQNRVFELRYSLGTTPIRVEDTCPDLLMLSVNNNLEYQLAVTSSDLLDEELGCAESATIYFFTIQNGSLHLNKVDYAG